ncbi:MAG: hypothetical protein V4534_01460 [Myxococcota bacterium]
MKRFLILGLLATQLSAYEYQPGEWLMRGVLGNSIYFIQDSSTGIGDNIVAGIEVETMLDRNWSVGGAFKPTFANNRLALGLGASAKYRFVNKDNPLIPFVSLGLAPSLMIPTIGDGARVHFNLGIRPTAGFEYFVTRDLALGLETAMTPSFLFGKGTTNVMEASIEVLVGATWRL